MTKNELNGMTITRPKFKEAYSTYTSVYSLTLNSGEIVSVYVLDETCKRGDII